MKNVRECVLSFALSIIPNQITNHSKLEKLTLRRSKITEIIGIFTTNDVEYRKLISSFFESDYYVTDITDAIFLSPSHNSTRYSPTFQEIDQNENRIKNFSNEILQSDERNHFINIEFL